MPSLSLYLFPCHLLRNHKCTFSASCEQIILWLTGESICVVIESATDTLLRLASPPLPIPSKDKHQNAEQEFFGPVYYHLKYDKLLRGAEDGE